MPKRVACNAKATGAAAVLAEARQPAWEPSFGRSSARTSGPGRRSSSTRRDQASLHAAALVVVAGRDREGRTGTTPALLVEACPKPALLALTAAPPHALAPPRVAISLRFSLSLHSTPNSQPAATLLALLLGVFRLNAKETNLVAFLSEKSEDLGLGKPGE